MSGFTPASAAVRLASRPALGQAAADVQQTASYMATAQEQALSDLTTSINTLPESQRPPLAAEAQKCSPLIAAVRTATSEDDLRQKAFTSNACLLALDGLVSKALAAMPKTAAAPQAVPAPAPPVPAAGAPTWAYVLGGVVLAGVLLWAFSAAGKR